ncbi:MAG: HlyD family efflux transporter periplasmic adaptor subunit [Endozoicomonas sp.]
MMDAPVTLPLLREDLKIYPGPEEADGSPSWTLHDPVNNRFLRLRNSAHELLIHWYCGDPLQVLYKVRGHSGINLTLADLQEFIAFLHTNSLIRRDQPDAPTALADEEEKRNRRSFLGKLVHNYLFFRIPLVRPDRFLDATVAKILPLMQWKVALVIMLLGLSGIILTFRQWDSFKNSFLHFFSLEGLLYYGSALMFVKILHELGHAYTAKKYGCRIPTMGVAFLVMFPVLYTDTTDSWKLTSYRQRMFIGAAGMLTELSIACIATFTWPFLSDGPLRSAVFIVASLTWITTLVVNLNPLMRFDGYYLLSDFWRLENLQSRAFNLARWNLRRFLFGVQMPPPEQFTRSMQRKLLIYAYSTWIYRFFLFLGIALLVYYFFFKALGIFLFVVEIIWFIALPIANELANWWRLRKEMTFNKNSIMSLGGGLFLLGLLFIPWQKNLYLPAIAVADKTKQFYPPENARIEQVMVSSGQQVTRGQTLATLSSPELVHEKATSERKAQLLQTMLDRSSGDISSRQNAPRLRQQLVAQRQHTRSVSEKIDDLKLKAPFDGTISQVSKDLSLEQWVNAQHMLFRLVSPGQWQTEAYVTESNLYRVNPGQAARFYSDDPDIKPFNLTLQEVNSVGNSVMDYEYFSSDYGGPIAVQRDDENKPVPTDGLYRLVLVPAPGEEIDLTRITPGTIRLNVEGRSIARFIWEDTLTAVLRESGF